MQTHTPKSCKSQTPVIISRTQALQTHDIVLRDSECQANNISSKNACTNTESKSINDKVTETEPYISRHVETFPPSLCSRKTQASENYHKTTQTEPKKAMKKLMDEAVTDATDSVPSTNYDNTDKDSSGDQSYMQNMFKLISKKLDTAVEIRNMLQSAGDKHQPPTNGCSPGVT